MEMIKKLVNYIERYEIGPFKMLMCNDEDVDKLEKQRDEMLEALIEEVLHAEGGGFHLHPRVIIMRDIIERSTGKTWAKIKDTINE